MHEAFDLAEDLLAYPIREVHPFHLTLSTLPSGTELSPCCGQERTAITTNAIGGDRGVKILEPRIIKTDEQHRMFLAEVERLATLNLDPESIQGLRLELLAKLVEDYEKTRFAFTKPDPVDAIRDSSE